MHNSEWKLPWCTLPTFSVLMSLNLDVSANHCIWLTCACKKWILKKTLKYKAALLPGHGVHPPENHVTPADLQVMEVIYFMMQFECMMPPVEDTQLFLIAKMNRTIKAEIGNYFKKWSSFHDLCHQLWFSVNINTGMSHFCILFVREDTMTHHYKLMWICTIDEQRRIIFVTEEGWLWRGLGVVMSKY